MYTYTPSLLPLKSSSHLCLTPLSWLQLLYLYATCFRPSLMRAVLNKVYILLTQTQYRRSYIYPINPNPI